MGLELEFLFLFTQIFLSLIYSPNQIIGLFDAVRFVVLILSVYLIINLLLNVYEIKYIIIFITIISIILAIFSKKEGFKSENLIINILTEGKKLQGRSEINIADANIFATHFFLPIIFVASLIVTKGVNLKYKVTASIILLVLLAGIAATFSRSAWIAVGFGLMLISYLRKQYKIIVILTLLLFFGIIFIPQLQLVAENLWQRILEIFSGTKDDSSRLRILLLIAGLNMAADSYLIGVGFRAFPIIYTQYYSKYESIGVLESHGLVYSVIAEQGIFGLLLCCWIFYKIWKTAYKKYQENQYGIQGSIAMTLFISYISYLIFYQFYGGAFWDNNLWILVALIYSQKYINNGVKTIDNENIISPVAIPK